MKSEYYRPLPHNVTVGHSEIEGLGLFATEDIPIGNLIGLTHIEFVGFLNNYIRTPLGGFINHSDNPNSETIKSYLKNNTTILCLWALMNIKKGEEITLKYSFYDPRK